ncbi:MAG: folate-binding protein YgfZ [Granulosicoccus sp.]
MSDKWKKWLVEEGLESSLDQETIGSDHTVNPSKKAHLVDLSDLVVLEVTGSDARDFLQGQFCNDLQQVTEQQAQITGYCTPKGRLLALPTLLLANECFYLLLPHSVSEAFQKRLSMFVLRSEVSIGRRDDLVCVGLISDANGSFSSAGNFLDEALPTEALGVVANADGQQIRWHADYSDGSRRERVIRLTSVENQIAMWNACADLVRSSYANWQMADVSAGIPVISEAVKEAFVPQMVNLHLINALSFTKGCYPGQEIVARMQYLGKLKRHMRLFAFDSAQTPLSGGANLRTGEDADAGVIVSAVRRADGSGLLLAVVKVTHNEDELFAGDQPLVSQPLPYDVPSMMQDPAQAKP